MDLKKKRKKRKQTQTLHYRPTSLTSPSLCFFFFTPARLLLAHEPVWPSNPRDPPPPIPPQPAAGQAAFLLRTCGPPEPARPTAAAREPSNLLSPFSFFFRWLTVGPRPSGPSPTSNIPFRLPCSVNRAAPPAVSRAVRLPPSLKTSINAR
jgi:hypothetical protein